MEMYTKAQLVEWIENGVENDPDIRRQMRAIFQRANRRIQNIENSIRAGRIGYSPAYDAVIQYTGTRGGKFSKFHMVGSWDKMLEQTAQAMAFLNEDTSTASGARAWQRSLQKSITRRNGEPISDAEMSRFMAAVYGDMQTNDTFKGIAERYILSATEVQVQNEANDMTSFIDAFVRETENNKHMEAERMADYIDSLSEQFYTVIRDTLH